MFLINQVTSNIKYPILLEVKSELQLSNHIPNTNINYVDIIFKFLEFVNTDVSCNLTKNPFQKLTY